jgi:NAD+ synthase
MAAHLSGWVAAKVREAGLDGAVVGVSGGVDSALVAALCRRAVGDQAFGLILPCHSAPEDVLDAHAVASALGLATHTVDLGPAYDALLQALAQAGGGVGAGARAGAPDLAAANIKPRLRMIALYHYANRRRLLVVGTSNRAESYVGYATKHGDAGVDIQPLAGLLKREVKSLAAHMGVPLRIVERVPSAGLWAGQTDEGEMGLTYAELDEYLSTGGARPEVRERIEAMHRQSCHKRRMPPAPPPMEPQPPTQPQPPRQS